MRNFIRHDVFFLLASFIFLPVFSIAQSWTGDARITNIGFSAPKIMVISVEQGKRIPGEYVSFEGGDEYTIETRKNERLVKKNGRYKGYLIGRGDTIMRTFDRFSGRGMKESKITQIALKSETDPNYTAETFPVSTAIKSRITDVIWKGDWDMAFAREIKIYLELPHQLVAGKVYQLLAEEVNLTDTSFRFNPRMQRSEAVHVNQLGFSPSSPVKVGFLSCWAADLGALEYENYKPFYLINHTSDEIVYTGITRLAKAKENPWESDLKHNMNFTQTDVYYMDFSDFQTPGYYRLCVEDIGCSYPFLISGDVYQPAMDASLNGLFTHRSGIEIDSPYAKFNRPRAMHPDDGFKIYKTNMTLTEFNESGMDFELLLSNKTNDTIADAWGGYMDAGDWDRHTGHLIAPRMIFEILELFPQYYDTLTLNIPENTNDLPDLVDEALWSIDLYRRLQNQDGSIPGGIESSEHPLRMEPSWHESLTIMLFKPGLLSTYRYAATAAKAAFWFQEHDKPQWEEIYKQSALKAYTWAENQVAQGSDEYNYISGFKSVVDSRNLAAAELFRLTDADSIHDVFLETTAFNTVQNKLESWNNFSQQEAPFVYIVTESDKKDADIENNCKLSIQQDADDELNYQQTTAFRWSKDPNGVLGFGSNTAPRVISMLQAYQLTEDEKYLTGAINGSQYTLGANPLNIVFTTGLGHKSPTNPLHIDSYNTGQNPPVGITVYGPFNNQVDFPDYWSYTFTEEAIKPEITQWPPIEYYQDVGTLNSYVCEYTIQQTIAPHFYVMGFLNGIFAGEATYQKPEEQTNSVIKTNNEEVIVFPNPINDRVNIQLMNNEKSKIEYSIYDMLGKKVLSGQPKILSNSSFTIDVQDLRPGCYILMIQASSSLYQTKIVKRD